MSLFQTCPHCKMVNHNFEGCIVCEGKSKEKIQKCTACDGSGVVRIRTCWRCGEIIDEQIHSN